MTRPIVRPDLKDEIMNAIAYGEEVCGNLPPEKEWRKAIPGESEYAFGVFIAYRDLEKRPRAVWRAYVEYARRAADRAPTEALAQKLRTSAQKHQKLKDAPKDAYRWRNQFFWEERTAVFDGIIQQYDSQSALYEWMKRRKENRHRDLAIVDLCKERFEEALRTLQLEEDGRIVRLSPLSGRDLGSMLEMASTLEERALGNNLSELEALVQVIESGILPAEVLAVLTEYLDRLNVANPAIASQLAQEITKASHNTTIRES